jgi:hypothetical protein
VQEISVANSSLYLFVLAADGVSFEFLNLATFVEPKRVGI